MDSNHKKLKQSKSTNKIDTDGRLPEELIIEILVRLPVKPLLKFKCVSKSWLASISSRRFARSHFAIYFKADQSLNSQVLMTPRPTLSYRNRNVPAIKQISLYSALYEDNVSAIDFPSLGSYGIPVVVGIVNGLVCFRVREGFLLWNPALRNSKLLPVSKERKLEYSMYGFGYDELNDDYKVVFLLKGNDNAEVYSLLANSWRTIDDYYKGDRPKGWDGEYANGKIHWLVGSSPGNQKVTSLDMVSEKFGELQLPEYEFDSRTHTVFGVSNERLYLLCKYDYEKTDVWVMDKYGVQESWSKIVSIPNYELGPTYDYTPWVVCILRNGEIVLPDRNGCGLKVYNPEHKNHRDIELDRQRPWIFSVYVESLVSLNGSS